MLKLLTLKKAHTEISLSRLVKDDLIRLALDYQQIYVITLEKISKEPPELCESYNKLESHLAITKVVSKPDYYAETSIWEKL